ncbi:MAG: hydroxymethylglutaryl-CoA lyase [Candidatus Eremiobacteraeota bacterium]|nr:hydroxymethylglutaryl-CoA lyase [Candidatus Eremiobacteraeota bacterium]
MNIAICDVAPRDGLQNDATQTTPEMRAELCARLAACGLPSVEAVSFVNEKRVPRMAGAERVVALLPKGTNTEFNGLVLNERGYERALATDLASVHYAFPVTDAFGERNQGSSVRDSLTLAKRLIERARADGRGISIGLAVAFGCPFEGAVEPERVLEIAGEVATFGPDAISFADTIGVGVPKQVRALVGGMSFISRLPIGCHFHDTRNTAVANALAAIEAGATILDASVGGVGGCPFAPAATGNVATEDLVYMLHGMGYETGIDLDRLISVAKWLEKELGHPVPSALKRAGPFKLSA